MFMLLLVLNCKKFQNEFFVGLVKFKIRFIPFADPCCGEPTSWQWWCFCCPVSCIARQGSSSVYWFLFIFYQLIVVTTTTIIIFWIHGCFKFMVSKLDCNRAVGIFSGLHIIAYVTARRKTFAGQKCEYGSTKKNWGASKKLASGVFRALIFFPSS